MNITALQIWLILFDPKNASFTHCIPVTHVSRQSLVNNISGYGLLETILTYYQPASPYDIRLKISRKCSRKSHEHLFENRISKMKSSSTRRQWVNTLRAIQNGHLFADDIFKCISLNEKFRILNRISLKYVPWGLIDNMAVLVQIMAWRRTGDKPLSEPMLLCCTDAYIVTRPQWVNWHQEV